MTPVRIRSRGRTRTSGRGRNRISYLGLLAVTEHLAAPTPQGHHDDSVGCKVDRISGGKRLQETGAVTRGSDLPEVGRWPVIIPGSVRS